MPRTIRPVPQESLILTQAGINYLKAKILNGDRGKLAKFRYGDRANSVLNVATTTSYAGNLTYEGLATSNQMFFNKVHTNEVVVRCQLTHDIGDFQAGSIAILSDDDTAVFVGRLGYAHTKMATQTTKAGGRLNFQFRFLMQDIQNHWDFSNLQEHYAELESFGENFADMPSRPIYADTTEQIQTDAALVDTNRNGYLLMPSVYDLTWTSNGFGARLDDENFGDFVGFSGGVDGDNHVYTSS